MVSACSVITVINSCLPNAVSAVSFRTSIYVGDTYYTAEELEDLIAHMGREYLGRRYHLLQTNCNSFTSDASFALCGERPPGWINRLAGVALAVHCLCWVPPLQPPSMVPNFDGVCLQKPSLNTALSFCESIEVYTLHVLQSVYYTTLYMILKPLTVALIQYCTLVSSQSWGSKVRVRCYLSVL